MGLENRPYYREDPGWRPERPSFGQMLGLSSMGLMVKWLIIINVAVFIVQQIAGEQFSRFFAASGASWSVALQVWRLITFQFLHGSFWHIFGNMLGLFFFGTMMERSWGSKRFLRFYLTCGAVGGAVFVITNMMGYIKLSLLSIGLVGASGGVLGILAACAIMFPQMKVYTFALFIPFPIPIRILVLMITIGYVLNVAKGGINYGGDICHLGGMATAAVWIFLGPYLPRLKARPQKGAWDRKLQNEDNLRFEADRILAKVHEKGIQSLTAKEKEILQKATQLQQKHGRGPGPYNS